MKIAKVAVTNVLIWYCTWTPYAVTILMGQFGAKHLITPFVSQVIISISLYPFSSHPPPLSLSFAFSHTLSHTLSLSLMDYCPVCSVPVDVDEDLLLHQPNHLRPQPSSVQDGHEVKAGRRASLPIIRWGGIRK